MRRISQDRACKILGISVSTIKRIRNCVPGLSVVKHGGKVWYDRDEVLSLAKAKRDAAVGDRLLDAVTGSGKRKEEVAAEIGVCVKTLYDWFRGTVPSSRNIPAVMRFIEEHENKLRACAEATEKSSNNGRAGLFSVSVSQEIYERASVAAWYLRASTDELVAIAVEQMVKDVESTIDKMAVQK